MFEVVHGIDKFIKKLPYKTKKKSETLNILIVF